MSDILTFADVFTNTQKPVKRLLQFPSESSGGGLAALDAIDLPSWEVVPRWYYWFGVELRAGLGKDDLRLFFLGLLYDGLRSGLVVLTCDGYDGGGW